MKKLLLSAVSATALIVSASAFADMGKVERTAEQKNAPEVTSEEAKQELKEGWKKTKEAVSETAKDVSDATKEAYHDIKEAILDDKKVTTANTIKIDQKTMASHMIGEPIYNAQNERVAKVNDIIVNQGGSAELIVLGDGDFTGLGKEAAYDYNIIAKRSPDGKIFAPLSEEMLDQAADFSYDRDSAKSGVRVIPANGYSLNSVLGGNVTNPQDETLAKIEDVVIQDGTVKYFIVGYNKTIGMGGDRAVLNYKDVQPVTKDGKMSFQLSAKKSAQFEIFKNKAEKESATN